MLREVEEGTVGEEVECGLRGGSGAGPDDGYDVSFL
jgi:hypothetical protein